MSLRFLSALVVALTAGVSALAVEPRAGTMQQSVSGRLLLDSSIGVTTRTMSIEAFPSRLGRLSGVHVELCLEAPGHYGVENVSAMPGIALAQVYECFALCRADGSSLTGTTFAIERVHLLGGFDQVRDFAGASGEIQKLDGSTVLSVDLPPTRNWTDLGSGPVLTLDLLGVVCFGVSGSGTIASQLEGAANFRVDVTYSYL